MLVANKVPSIKMLATNEDDNVGGSNRLNDGSKYIESKIGITSKFQKLSKSRKNSSKSGNSPNFGATKSGPSFLTHKTRSAFNRLWLTFIKAPILWYFDPECHIWIKTDASGYAIDGVLSKLASKTSPDAVVTKANLS